MPKPWLIRNGLPQQIAIPQGLAPSPARPFFNGGAGRSFGFRAAAAGVTEIELYDEIGYWGVSARDFRARLASVTGGTIVLKINSPGGDVFDGLTIYNDLIAHPAQVHVVVTGLAASAASIVAMAGDRVAVCDNAFLMIHNASTAGYGNRHDLRSVADVLDQIDRSLAATYAARTGTQQAEIQALMDAETWFSAADAVAAGLADAPAPAEPVTACYDLSTFAAPPAALVAAMSRPQRPPERTARDAEIALAAAGFGRVEARMLAARAFGADLTDTPDDTAAGLAALAQLNDFIASITPH